MSLDKFFLLNCLFSTTKYKKLRLVGCLSVLTTFSNDIFCGNLPILKLVRIKYLILTSFCLTKRPFAKNNLKLNVIEKSQSPKKTVLQVHTYHDIDEYNPCPPACTLSQVVSFQNKLNTFL